MRQSERSHQWHCLAWLTPPRMHSLTACMHWIWHYYVFINNMLRSHHRSGQHADNNKVQYWSGHSIKCFTSKSRSWLLCTMQSDSGIWNNESIPVPFVISRGKDELIEEHRSVMKSYKESLLRVGWLQLNIKAFCARNASGKVLLAFLSSFLK